MPVSPADFEFYSRVTGQPIPRDPAARMKMAPAVYSMRRGPLSGIRDRLGGAVRGALIGGALVGAGALASAVAADERKAEKSVEKEKQLAEDLKTNPRRQLPSAAMRAAEFLAQRAATRPEELGGVSVSATPPSQEQLRGDIDLSGATTGELYSQKYVGNQTNYNLDQRGGIQANTLAASPQPITQAQELSDSQALEPTGVDTTPEISSQPVVSHQSARVKAEDLLGRVFGTAEQPPSQLAKSADLTPQERDIRETMKAYEMVEGQALAGQDQSISAFQVDGAMRSLNEQNSPARQLIKSMPGATKEQLVAAQSGSTDIGGSDLGAQSIIFPESASVKGMSIFPSATGEGGIGRADIIYRNVSKEEKDLPVEERGRYPYMLSAEGQKRAQRIASGKEQTPSKASKFLTDFTEKGQLISMDPLAEDHRYGINPSLRTIL